ncbi:hypothetical protein G7067_10405 [Leucobacter insecticola]|uniref:ABC3 transporter permease C-terminal domain-containing protein n=1 Tax=Leucobacter insecticola TaxID=2714934 RepID=A0A6G8FJS7_9MICO|nr:FtsX-like permease family protein [Leucobacter insecticola]QIM16720.1 hypothetical protein G7067_10405 [Leucobacter insecticola]
MKNLGTLTWLIGGRAKGGRLRLVGTAAGLAVGTMLLLLVFAAYQGMTDRAARADVYTHLGYAGLPSQGGEDTSPELGATEFLTMATSFGGGYDRFQDQRITRVDVAAAASSAATLPGLDALPEPGEYLASPALAELISKHPEDQLGARYGSMAGLIGDAGLMGPDTLLIVIGHDPHAIAQTAGVITVDAANLTGSPYQNFSYMIIALIGGLAVLFPVVILISIVTKLDQAARSDRFRTLGLVGATPMRIATISAFETAAVGIIGTFAGVVLYWLSLPVVAQLRIGESRFFVSDLTLSLGGIVAAAVLIILSTTLTAHFSALRAQRGIRSTARDIPEKRPSLWRLTPLTLGLGLLAVTATASLFYGQTPENERSGIAALLIQLISVTLIPSFLFTAFGLVLAGPLLLSWTARLSVRRAKSPEGVLALNRLMRRPSATFRTVSGLVLALFVVTVFAVALTTDQTEQTQNQAAATSHHHVPFDAFMAEVSPSLAYDSSLWNETESTAAIAAAQHLTQTASEVSGVTGAFVIFNSSPSFDDNRYLLRTADARALGLDVPNGAEFVSVSSDYFYYSPTSQSPPPVTVKAAEGLAPLGVPMFVVVTTDGTSGTQERVRTTLSLSPFSSAITHGSPPQTLNEGMQNNGSLSWAQQYKGLANIGIVIAALISVVSLAVSILAGVIERRRALALLRLTGMPATKLRRMITLEAAVPFATTFLLCIVTGAFTAWAIITGLNPRRTVTWPEPGYYLAVVFCLLAAILAVLATFRTVGRSTALTETRFE